MSQRADPKNQNFIHRLFTEHNTGLVKYLTRKTSNPEEAQDIAQSAFQKMMSVADAEALDNSKGYLYQIASNLAIDRIRKQQHHAKYVASQPQGDEETANAPSPERTVEAKQKLAKIQDIVDKLPEKSRKAFILNRTENLSYTEISQQLGVSVSSVEKYIMQALTQIRKNLEN